MNTAEPGVTVEPGFNTEPGVTTEPCVNTAESAQCPGRKPGRPREKRAGRAIIDATLDLFADDGYHALSMEAVALKAGVSKATVYRRWPGKRELVIDALATLNDNFPMPSSDVGTRERLLAGLRYLSDRDTDSLAGRIMPRMMVYSVSQPDLYAEYYERVIMPRRRWLHQVLREGVEQGELRADLDVELAAMALVGPVVLQVHSLGWRQPHSQLPEHLLELLWPGLSARSEDATAANGAVPSTSVIAASEREATGR